MYCHTRVSPGTGAALHTFFRLRVLMTEDFPRVSAMANGELSLLQLFQLLKRFTAFYRLILFFTAFCHLCSATAALCRTAGLHSDNQSSRRSHASSPATCRFTQSFSPTFQKLLFLTLTFPNACYYFVSCALLQEVPELAQEVQKGVLPEGVRDRRVEGQRREVPRELLDPAARDPGGDQVHLVHEQDNVLVPPTLPQLSSV